MPARVAVALSPTNPALRLKLNLAWRMRSWRNESVGREGGRWRVINWMWLLCDLTLSAYGWIPVCLCR